MEMLDAHVYLYESFDDLTDEPITMSFMKWLSDVFQEKPTARKAVSGRYRRQRFDRWQRIEIWNRAGRKCYHCGKKLQSSTAKHMHVDHLLPISKGGSKHVNRIDVV
jgi:5-methylcytosine-specific restriction endonuclease McrA